MNVQGLKRPKEGKSAVMRETTETEGRALQDKEWQQAEADGNRERRGLRSLSSLQNTNIMEAFT